MLCFINSFAIFRSCPIVKTALQMSLSYFEGNWVRICRLMVELPALLACIAALHLPNIRRYLFMCCALCLELVTSLRVLYKIKLKTFVF